MGYDCSITKRQGCNYCLKEKSLFKNINISMKINDNDCNGNAYLETEVILKESSCYVHMDINYCPICGKKL